MEWPFPALLIGGSNAQAKAYMLAQLCSALNAYGRRYAMLRANDAAPEHIAQLILKRVLPLLLDSGDLDQEALAALARCCTHAVIVPSEPHASSWYSFARACGLRLLHHDSSLIDQIVALFHYDNDTLFQAHLRHIPDAYADLVLHIERPLFPFPDMPLAAWQPAHLPELLASLPHGEPLGIYGHGPTWLLAALAVFAYPASCILFDQLFGWVLPPTLQAGELSTSSPLDWTIEDRPEYRYIQCLLASPLIEPDRLQNAAIPYAAMHHGVILAGKIPVWLFAALARSYQANAWLAIAEDKDAIVLRSQIPNKVPGSLYFNQ